MQHIFKYNWSGGLAIGDLYPKVPCANCIKDPLVHSGDWVRRYHTIVREAFAEGRHVLMLWSHIAWSWASAAHALLVLGIIPLRRQLLRLLRFQMLLQAREPLPSLPTLPFLPALPRPGLRLLLRLFPTTVLVLPCHRLSPSTRTCSGWSCGNCSILPCACLCTGPCLCHCQSPRPGLHLVLRCTRS